MIPDWLPSIIELSQYNGDWECYLAALYEVFCNDFIHSKPTTFAPKRWAMKRHPMTNGKEATFWHLIQSGNVEAERLPDMRRCERIPWVRPMIDARGTGRVHCWSTVRDGDERPAIALPDFSYVVILEAHNEYVMLWTAFYVEQGSRRNRLRKEYERCRVR